MGCGSSSPTVTDKAAADNRENEADNRENGADDNYWYDNTGEETQPYYDGSEDNNNRNTVTDDNFFPADRRGGEETDVPEIPIHEPKPEKDSDKLIDTSDTIRYKSTTVGTYEAYFDFRINKEPFDDETRPLMAPGELWIDEEFPLHVAIKESADGSIEWKRPFEFCENPVLFADGTTRFDIGQGSAGTCWFLSMVANISEKTALLNRVIPEDSYRINTQQYDGIFHSKFWRFGQWDHVYIDDYLPVVYDTQLWGAKSATDKNEMWVSLLEKSFGKLYGSYNSIYGGQPGDAYLSLTGGVVERIDFDENKISPIKLFKRVKNALKGGSLVSCVVPEEYDEVMGLVGGHAYSLNGTAIAETNSGQQVHLLRVRNPWGHTEWNGAWSDGSAEWQQLPPGMVDNPVKDDGEFWVSLDDFLQYFSQLTICSLTPDVDCDGSSDCLSHVMCIYGDWVGETAAGFQNRTANPRYVFTVSNDGMADDGTVPFVVQIIQRTIHRKSDRFSIRCDVYQVLGEKMSSSPCYVFEMVGGEETNVYSPEVQSTHRHHIKPGKYVVIPSTIEAGQEKEYLIRIFSAAPLLDVRQVSRQSVIMACEEEKEVEYQGQQYQLGICRTIFGEWMYGVNAGGQISHQETFSSNPQFLFNIPNTVLYIPSGDYEPVVFHLMQESLNDKLAVGLRVFPYDGSSPLPLDINYIYNNYDNCPQHIEGSQGKFVITYDLDVKYVLPAGQFVVIIHMDQPTDTRKYSLVVKSRCDLSVRSFNSGE